MNGVIHCAYDIGITTYYTSDHQLNLMNISRVFLLTPAWNWTKAYTSTVDYGITDKHIVLLCIYLRWNSSLNKTLLGCQWLVVGTKTVMRDVKRKISFAYFIFLLECPLDHLVRLYTDVAPLSGGFRHCWLPMLTVSMPVGNYPDSSQWSENCFSAQSSQWVMGHRSYYY